MLEKVREMLVSMDASGKPKYFTDRELIVSLLTGMAESDVRPVLSVGYKRLGEDCSETKNPLLFACFGYNFGGPPVNALFYDLGNASIGRDCPAVDARVPRLFPLRLDDIEEVELMEHAPGEVAEMRLLQHEGNAIATAVAQNPALAVGANSIPESVRLGRSQPSYRMVETRDVPHQIARDLVSMLLLPYEQRPWLRFQIRNDENLHGPVRFNGFCPANDPREVFVDFIYEDENRPAVRGLLSNISAIQFCHERLEEADMRPGTVWRTPEEIERALDGMLGLAWDARPVLAVLPKNGLMDQSTETQGVRIKFVPGANGYTKCFAAQGNRNNVMRTIATDSIARVRVQYPPEKTRKYRRGSREWDRLERTNGDGDRFAGAAFWKMLDLPHGQRPMMRIRAQRDGGAYQCFGRLHTILNVNNDGERAVFRLDNTSNTVMLRPSEIVSVERMDEPRQQPTINLNLDSAGAMAGLEQLQRAIQTTIGLQEGNTHSNAMRELLRQSFGSAAVNVSAAPADPVRVTLPEAEQKPEAAPKPPRKMRWDD
jgi:hypothetical protein